MAGLAALALDPVDLAFQLDLTVGFELLPPLLTVGSATLVQPHRWLGFLSLSSLQAPPNPAYHGGWSLP